MLYFFGMSKININPSFSLLKTLLSQQRRLKESNAPLMLYLLIDEGTDMRTKKICVMNSTGQALVEMAIILPLLMLLVMGIFEFGRAMYIKNSLTQAARSGARVAAVTPLITATGSQVKLKSDCNYGINPTGNDEVYKAVCTSLYNGIMKQDVGLEIIINELSPPTGLNSGDMIEVKIYLDKYLSKYRIIPFIPLPDTLTGTTAMRYE